MSVNIRLAVNLPLSDVSEICYDGGATYRLKQEAVSLAARYVATNFGGWPQWAHHSEPYMGPNVLGRNHSQIYSHIRAKFGNDLSSRLVAYSWQTHTEFVLRL